MPPFNNDFWAAELARLQEIMDPVLLGAMLAGIDSGITLLPASAIPFVNVDLVNEAAIEFARNYTFDLVSGITDTTRRQLARAIQDWIREGQPLDVLTRRIEPIFGEARAEMIASTEVTRAYASGNMIAWTTNGLVGAKRWMTAVDERVCPVCGPLHNTIVQIDQAWRFTPAMLEANPELARAVRSLGNSFSMPPAHPRCILPGNKVVSPTTIEAAAKSFYDGPAIEITFGDGRTITVTENHPILVMDIGWIPANEIRETDYIVGSPNPGRIAAAINPDDNHVPRAIEDVFETLRMSSFMRSVSVPSSAEDFHGDGNFVKGDVDIVYPDSPLISYFDPAIGEHITNQLFSVGNVLMGIPLDSSRLLYHILTRHFAPLSDSMSGGDLRRSLFGGHLPPPDPLGGGLTSHDYSVLHEAARQGISANTKIIRQSDERFAIEIPLGDFVNIGNRPPPMATPVPVDPRFLHAAGNSLRADTRIAGDFCDRFASEITAYDVIKIRKFDFRGHVYDLQNNYYHLYFTNGIITHNCRCWLQPVVLEAYEPGELAEQFFGAVVYAR